MGFLRFIGFSVVRAWQGFWRNAMMSLATTATVVLMLVLLSGLYIVITGLNSGLSFIESKVGITAQLVGKPDQADLTPAQRDALIAYARSLPGVKDVSYVSPNQAMERLKEVYAQRGQKLDLGNDPEHHISIYASIEILLTEPKLGDSVATGPRSWFGEGVRSSSWRRMHTHPGRCPGGSSLGWRMGWWIITGAAARL